ncbi:hypothetical protein D3C73_1289800 [compost metagenome]
MVLTIIQAVALAMLMLNSARHSRMMQPVRPVTNDSGKVNSAASTRPVITPNLRLARMLMPRRTNMSQKRPATIVPTAPKP